MQSCRANEIYLIGFHYENYTKMHLFTLCISISEHSKKIRSREWWFTLIVNWYRLRIVQCTCEDTSSEECLWWIYQREPLLMLNQVARISPRRSITDTGFFAHVLFFFSLEMKFYGAVTLSWWDELPEMMTQRNLLFTLFRSVFAHINERIWLL